MTFVARLLVDTLARPGASVDYALPEWSLLIRQARAAEMLGQLHGALATAGVLDAVPAPARRHLDIAWQLSLRHREAVRWEIMHIRDALRILAIPVILLKGAAYCIAGNRAAVGRVFNDVDILVPKSSIDDAEKALIRGGWLPAPIDAYDQRYYRNWTHELPPMEHKERGTVLDVHHTIVPPVSGFLPDANALIRSSQRVDDPQLGMFSVLAPEDRIIHSASHLFLGEFHKGLRDLFDLHTLFEEFASDARFWERLVDRAFACRLGRPVLDAMVESRRLFGTAVPDEMRIRLETLLGRDWGRLPRARLFEYVLRPNHPSCDGLLSRAARWGAFARSHWLRMPLPLLVYHLGHKAIKGDRH